MAISLVALDFVFPVGVDRYVGLLSAAPDLFTGTFVEITDSSYERKLLGSLSKTDLGAGIGAYVNASAVVFDALIDDGVTVAHWAIFDAETGGDILYAGLVLNASLVAEPANVAIGEQVRFNAGYLRLQTEAT